MRQRGLTDDDRDIWAGYTRHVAVLYALPGAPTPRAPVPVQQPGPAGSVVTDPIVAEPVPVTVRLRARPMPVDIGAHPAGVDGGTWTRFRTGKLATTRVLDLHGRTAQAAHMVLHGFLRSAHADGVRCVEVITGRGQGEGGVIRRELPHWLNAPELRPLVLAAAHPHAANPGSVRLLLRRVRIR